MRSGEWHSMRSHHIHCRLLGWIGEDGGHCSKKTLGPWGHGMEEKSVLGMFNGQVVSGWSSARWAIWGIALSVQEPDSWHNRMRISCQTLLPPREVADGFVNFVIFCDALENPLIWPPFGRATLAGAWRPKSVRRQFRLVTCWALWIAFAPFPGWIRLRPMAAALLRSLRWISSCKRHENYCAVVFAVWSGSRNVQAQTYIRSKQQQSPRKPLPLTQVCTDFPLIYSSLDGFTALLCLEMLMTSSRYLQMCWQESMEVRIHQDLGFSFLIYSSTIIIHCLPLST